MKLFVDNGNSVGYTYKSENLCYGKQKYGSRKKAGESAVFLMDDSYGGTGVIKPYKCKKCKKYHLTSSVK